MNKFKITIERMHNGKEQDRAIFEIPEDSDLWTWKYTFEAILSFVTFNVSQIKEIFNEE